MDIAIEKAAACRILDLPPKARQALIERLKAIAAAPFAMHANVEAIKGATDTFRLRQGDWRAIYVIDRASEKMTVTMFEHRREVYR